MAAPIPYRPLDGPTIRGLGKPDVAISVALRHLAGARAKQQQLAERSMRAVAGRRQDTRERAMIARKGRPSEKPSRFSAEIGQQIKSIGHGYPEQKLKYVDQQVRQLERIVARKREANHPLRRSTRDFGTDD